MFTARGNSRQPSFIPFKEYLLSSSFVFSCISIGSVISHTAFTPLSNALWIGKCNPCALYLALAKSICYIHSSVRVSCHRSTYRWQTAYLSMSFSYPQGRKTADWLKKNTTEIMHVDDLIRCKMVSREHKLPRKRQSISGFSAPAFSVYWVHPLFSESTNPSICSIHLPLCHEY